MPEWSPKKAQSDVWVTKGGRSKGGGCGGECVWRLSLPKSLDELFFDPQNDLIFGHRGK